MKNDSDKGISMMYSVCYKLCHFDFSIFIVFSFMHLDIVYIYVHRGIYICKKDKMT